MGTKTPAVARLEAGGGSQRHRRRSQHFAGTRRLSAVDSRFDCGRLASDRPIPDHDGLESELQDLPGGGPNP